MKKSANLVCLHLAMGVVCFSANGSDRAQFAGQATGVGANEGVAAEQRPAKHSVIQNNGSMEAVTLAPKVPLLSPTEITTRDGATYRAVKRIRVQPDGLSIEYMPKGGGIGLVKLKFKDLPDALQQQFGYDAQKSADFEAEQARATEAWRARVLADYADATKRIAARLAEEQPPAWTEPEGAATARQKQGADEAEALNAEKSLVLQTRAKHGDLAARRELAQWDSRIFTASGSPEDRERAVNSLTPLAEMGDGYAQLALGKLLTGGGGFDVQEGVGWLRKAAEQGNPIAQGALGELYQDGRGVAQDTTEAIKWYRMAAERGCFQTELGALCETGKDYAEALKWYDLAAKGGATNAIDLRDALANRMPSGVVADAERRASEFKPIESGKKGPGLNLLAGD